MKKKLHKCLCLALLQTLSLLIIFSFKGFADEKVKCEKSEKENERFFNESLGMMESRTYIDINNDGRKEILISRDLGGLSSPAPNLYIEFFDQTCKISNFYFEKFLSSWEGWKDIDFSINKKITTLSAFVDASGWNSPLYQAKVVYSFDGKKVSLVTEEKTKEITALMNLRASFFHHNNDSFILEERNGVMVDLNHDKFLERITCGYNPRWGSLSDCEINTETTNIKLFAEEGFWFHPKRIGVLPETKNGWHVLIVDFNTQFIYQPSPINGYRKSN